MILTFRGVGRKVIHLGGAESKDTEDLMQENQRGAGAGGGEKREDFSWVSNSGSVLRVLFTGGPASTFGMRKT